MSEEEATKGKLSHEEWEALETTLDNVLASTNENLRAIYRIHSECPWQEIHETWESYCNYRWPGMGRTMIFRMLKASIVQNQMSESTIVNSEEEDRPQPENVSQYEALGDSPDPAASWHNAQVTTEKGSPTAEDIKKTVADEKDKAGKPKKKRNKRTVPKDFFKAAESKVGCLSRAVEEIRAAHDGDAFYSVVTMSIAEIKKTIDDWRNSTK